MNNNYNSNYYDGMYDRQDHYVNRDATYSSRTTSNTNIQNLNDHKNDDYYLKFNPPPLPTRPLAPVASMPNYYEKEKTNPPLPPNARSKQQNNNKNGNCSSNINNSNIRFKKK
jgi:hypothetical protein